MPKTSIKLYKKQLISLFAYANVVSITFVFLSYRLFTKFTEIFVSRIVVAAPRYRTSPLVW